MLLTFSDAVDPRSCRPTCCPSHAACTSTIKLRNLDSGCTACLIAEQPAIPRARSHTAADGQEGAVEVLSNLICPAQASMISTAVSDQDVLTAQAGPDPGSGTTSLVQRTDVPDTLLCAAQIRSRVLIVWRPCRASRSCREARHADVCEMTPSPIARQAHFTFDSSPPDAAGTTRPSSHHPSRLGV